MLGAEFKDLPLAYKFIDVSNGCFATNIGYKLFNNSLLPTIPHNHIQLCQNEE